MLELHRQNACRKKITSLASSQAPARWWHGRQHAQGQRRVQRRHQAPVGGGASAARSLAAVASAASWRHAWASGVHGPTTQVAACMVQRRWWRLGAMGRSRRRTTSQWQRGRHASGQGGVRERVRASLGRGASQPREGNPDRGFFWHFEVLFGERGVGNP